MSLPHPLDRARQHFYLGEYAEAEQVLRMVPTTAPEFGAAQVLLLRCLFNRGRIGEANQHTQTVLQLGLQPVDTQALRLWGALLRLFIHLPRPTAQDWQDLDATCTHAENDPSVTPSIHALGLDMRARAGNLRQGLGWATATSKDTVLAQHNRAAVAYQEAGEIREYFAARQRYANLLRSTPFPRLDEARAALIAIQQDAEKLQQPVVMAEAKLEQAILDFRLGHIGPQIAELGPIIQEFEATGQLFELAGHVEGQARTVAQFAEMLLTHGYKDGVDLAHEAIKLLTQVGDDVTRQSLWRELHKWHLLQGEASAARAARETAAQISQSMNFHLSSSVDLQAQADMAFRSGQVAEALNLLVQAGADPEHPDYAGPNAAPWLIRVSVFSQVGRDDEAIQILRDVIATLAVNGASPFLADAWSQLGHILLGRDDAEAVRCLREGARAAEQAGDIVGSAKLLSQGAWLQVQQRYRLRQQPISTDAIEAEFDQARSILLLHRMLDARLELGSLCELRGQAAFIAKEYAACGKWLDLATDLYNELGLKPQLAFTLVHQGMVLLEVGRTNGLNAYNAAAGLLARAHDLFDRCDMYGIAWRAVFYEGLCAYEAGRWEQAGSPTQQKRWHLSQQFLEEAANRVDLLRGLAAEVADIASQMTRIAFNVDKQLVYSTGLSLTMDYLGDTNQALRWLERSKSRALLDALASQDLPMPNALKDNPLIIQERTLSAQKRATQDVSKALALQQQIDTTLLKLTNDADTADYANLLRGDAIDGSRLRELLQQMGETQTLVMSYYCSPTGNFVLGMRADWDKPKVQKLNIDYSRLEQLIQLHFRRRDGFRMMLEDLGEDPWQQFDELVRPILEWSQPNETVCLIPHGILHDLPLHTLKVGGQYLIERNPMMYAMSVSVLFHVLQRVGSQVRTRAPHVAVFGDSRHNLPRSRTEAITIAQQMGVEPLLDVQVSRQAMLAVLHTMNVVHVAGHAEATLQAGLDGGLSLANGDKLTAAELMVERLSADMLVLSGCETGLSEHRPNDELLGLVRALLYAGLSSLVVSQWRVNDASTEELLKAFYRYAYAKNQTAMTLAQALQQAILDVHAMAGWESPYHWGSFVLVGDWR